MSAVTVCDCCGVTASPQMRMYLVEVLRHPDHVAEPDERGLGDRDLCWNCVEELTVKDLITRADLRGAQ